MSSATFQTWLQTRELHKSYIRAVMSKYFVKCQGNVKTIMSLVSKEYGVNILNGNSYMGFIEDMTIELSARDTFAKLDH